MVLYTIGHGRRPIEELIAALRAHGIHRLVDVRTLPGSKVNPQFNREALDRDLPAAGIAYEHRPELGGLRRGLGRRSPHEAWRNPGFRGYADYMLEDEFWSALDALLRAAAEKPTVIMCAETLWWRCHRRLIADAATARGADVRHIADERRVEAHRLLPPARLASDRVTYKQR